MSGLLVHSMRRQCLFTPGAVFDFLYSQIDKPLAVIAALDHPKILANKAIFQYKVYFGPVSDKPLETWNETKSNAADTKIAGSS